MAKRGRPSIDNPKDIKYSIRMDAKTEKELKSYCEKNNMSKGEAIRKAILLLLEKT